MKHQAHSGRAARLRRWIGEALFMSLLCTLMAALAVVSVRYRASADWTAVGRNSLSERSIAVLSRMTSPVHVEVFAREEKTVRTAARDLLDRYSREKSDFSYDFVNPDREPALARQFDIRAQGEMVVTYEGRQEQLRAPSEAALTAGLERLGRQGGQWIAFLTGHGERNLHGTERNFDLGMFGAALQERGYTVQPLDISRTGEVPSNTAVLILADERSTMPAGTARALIDFIDGGGNLLWLREPGARADGVQALEMALAIDVSEESIRDRSAAHSLGVDDDSLLVVGQYPGHPVTANLRERTLFPGAAALLAGDSGRFAAGSVLRTGDLARLSGDAAMPAAPYDIGISLQPRETVDGPHAQRLLVLGDTDFLSNAYLGNGGNLALGLSMIRWLAGDDELIGLPTRTAPDLSLQLSSTSMLVLAFGNLIGLPLLLLATGAGIHLYRRRR